LPDERRIRLRIGVNLGDIIVEGSDIYGDGVNVAARLEGLAEPGGICISGKVYEEVGSKLPTAFEDLGEQEVKNIVEPVRVYRWTDTAAAPMPGTVGAEGALPLPDKPSIAVLPFDNMSGDPEQEYFSDGITEDIITELSRFRSLFVIARNSSFTFKGEGVNVTEVGQKLGVAYVVEGSVRKADNRVRITAQLIEAATGNHVWAERYDRDLEDIFAVQDEVVLSIVSVLPGRISENRLRALQRNPTKRLGAYDLVLQGNFLLGQRGPENLNKALSRYRDAIALDENYADAHVGIASAETLLKFDTGDVGPQADVETALAAIRTSLTLDNDSDTGHAAAAFVYAFNFDRRRAIRHANRAIEINPNNATAYLNRASAHAWEGDAEAAVSDAQMAKRLDPFATRSGIACEQLADIYYLAGDYAQAAGMFEAIQSPADYIDLFLAASYAMLGEADRAAKAKLRFDVNTPNPEDILSYWVLEYLSNTAPSTKEHYLDGFRRAGFEL
jgi:TolB-like protein